MPPIPRGLTTAEDRCAEDPTGRRKIRRPRARLKAGRLFSLPLQTEDLMAPTKKDGAFTEAKKPRLGQMSRNLLSQPGLFPESA